LWRTPANITKKVQAKPVFCTIQLMALLLLQHCSNGCSNTVDCNPLTSLCTLSMLTSRMAYIMCATCPKVVNRSRLQTGSAPQMMAALRNLAITLIHRCGSSQIAASRRHFASHPPRLLPSSKGDLPSNNSQALCINFFSDCLIFSLHYR
jgi:hypothetical protein